MPEDDVYVDRNM